MEKSLQKSNKQKTREMTILAMFIGIIAVLGLVPSGLGSSSLGFIKITPNIEATIIHIPVIIGAALLGRKMGFYLGTAFGVVSLIAAFIYSSPLFVYPWVSVLPRMIFGFVIYDVVQFFVKTVRNKLVGYMIGFFVATIIHTILVLTMLWTSYSMVLGTQNLFEDFVPYVSLLAFLLVPVTALIEAILAGTLGAGIVLRLQANFDNQNNE